MSEHYEIEAFTPFSESKIWQLNRDFYHERGISAWSEPPICKAGSGA